MGHKLMEITDYQASDMVPSWEDGWILKFERHICLSDASTNTHDAFVVSKGVQPEEWARTPH